MENVFIIKTQISDNIKVPQPKAFIIYKEYFGCDKVHRECKQKAITVTETTIQRYLWPAICGDAF